MHLRVRVCMYVCACVCVCGCVCVCVCVCVLIVPVLHPAKLICFVCSLSSLSKGNWRMSLCVLRVCVC